MAKYDYDSLERQYVKGNMSIRQLCRDNDIVTWSTVSATAKRKHWEQKREDWRSRAQKAEEAVVIDNRVSRVQKALDDAVVVMSRSIFSFSDSLEDRWVTDPESGQRHFVPGQPLSGTEFVRIIEKLQIMAGQPTDRTDHLNLNINADTGDTLEALRELAALARERGADVTPTGSSPLPGAEGAKSVN